MKEVKAKIISHKKFSEDTYLINHIESRIKLNDEQLKKIDYFWDLYKSEAISKGGKVWDGTYYRLENIHNINSELKFSTIKYSTIRGLTHNQDLSLIPIDSRPNHISTASLIQTSDNLFVFGERNNNSMNSSRFDLIGGGLQPGEHKVRYCRDLFENQKKEMKEELGIKPKNIKLIKGIGITLSSKYNVIFIFYTRLNISKNQLLEIFKNNATDEMQNLKFKSEKELQNFLCDKGSYRPLTAELYFMNCL